MSFEQRLAVVVGASIVGALVVEGFIRRIWPRILDWSDRYIDNMVDRALAEITFTDDEVLHDLTDVATEFGVSLDDEAADAAWDDLIDQAIRIAEYRADPFATTRAEIAALETTEERK